jgi:transcriptional regulator with XRE-family HTH domain
MGRYHRTKPARLAEKLLQIRTALGLSQNEMLRSLGLEEEMTRGRISGYELGTREPSLPTLLRYARCAGLCVDDLIDDDLDLPKKIPAFPNHAHRKRSDQKK